MKVKSEAAAPRGINVMVDGKPGQMLIHPGETVDVELVDPRDKVFYGMVAKRELLLEEQQKVPAPPPAAEHHEEPKPAVEQHPATPPAAPAPAPAPAPAAKPAVQPAPEPAKK